MSNQRIHGSHVLRCHKLQRLKTIVPHLLQSGLRSSYESRWRHDWHRTEKRLGSVTGGCEGESRSVCAPPERLRRDGPLADGACQN